MSIIQKLGRRKTSVARIRMVSGTGKVTVNKKDYKEYFPQPTLQTIIQQAFDTIEGDAKFDVIATCNGCGITGQAEAIRLAISRGLCEDDAENRPALKKEGFLTRDPRMVERKKPGRRKARKKFQFSKR